MWTDGKGGGQPAPALFCGLLSEDNPYLGELEPAYRELAEAMRVRLPFQGADIDDRPPIHCAAGGPGEGHRKVWARLRVIDVIRVARKRVLRMMRASTACCRLIAPARPARSLTTGTSSPRRRP